MKDGFSEVALALVRKDHPWFALAIMGLKALIVGVIVLTVAKSGRGIAASSVSALSRLL